MGVVIESEVWEPQPLLYLFLFAACFSSIFFLPYFTNNSKTSTLSDLGGVSSSTFLRFQRRFLLVYSLCSVMEGLESVFGEFEYGYYGVSREEIVMSLSVGSAAALFVGTFLGMLSDLIGQKKICVLFCVLHLFVGVLKSVTNHPSMRIPTICLAIASSVFSFSFETWMVAEHEKLGHNWDLLSETFWVMTFSESASFIGTQGLANLLVGRNAEKGIGFPSTVAAFLAVIGIICISREWNGSPSTSDIGGYQIIFSARILSDKRVWLLSWAQACLHFSITIFWILWAPTIVADGRDVHLSMIYPYLMGARMLGSTAVPWFLSGALSVSTDDCLTVAFVVAGLALSIVAYDYQEIGVLVAIFCLFHACVGLILPSLARLRTIYVPNELRGGMISLSLAPANAAVLFILIQGDYYRKLGNSAIIALSALGLLSSAGCIYLLKRWRKQPHQNWHKL